MVERDANVAPSKFSSVLTCDAIYRVELADYVRHSVRVFFVPRRHHLPRVLFSRSLEQIFASV